jgi:hypothetical protein
MALALLKHSLESHDGLARRSFLAMERAAFDDAELLPLFTTSGGLERWLAASARLGGSGEPVALALRDGGTLTGRVLAVSKREAAFSWDETGGVLELKGFSEPGGQRVVSLGGTFWGRPAADVGELERRLRPSLARLAGLLAASAART